MNADTRKVGQWGEGVAAGFLLEKGYTILVRNFHSSVGELDIVAVGEDRGLPCLVFVEVKTRTSGRLGFPEESVSRKKLRHIRAAIQAFFESHPTQVYEWRVDVIAVLGQPGQKKPQIQHFENIVMVDERD